jgi:hypothetical protein
MTNLRGAACHCRIFALVLGEGAPRESAVRARADAFAMLRADTSTTILL